MLGLHSSYNNRRPGYLGAHYPSSTSATIPWERWRQQQYQRKNQACFLPKADDFHPCSETPDDRHAEEEVSMSQGPANSPLSINPPHDERQKGAPSFQSRTLPPILSGKTARAPLDAVPWSQSAPNVSMRPTPPPSSTPPEQRSSRPIGVQNLLNPACGENANFTSRRNSVDYGDDSPRSAQTAVMSRSATPALSVTSVARPPSIDVALPIITPPLVNAYPLPAGRTLPPRSPSIYAQTPITSGLPSATIDAKQSPFVLTRDHSHASLHEPDATFVPPNAYPISMQPTRSPPKPQTSQEIPQYPILQSLLDRSGGAGVVTQTRASQTNSPSTQFSSYTRGRITPPAAAALPMVSSGQPTSFFSAPFSTSGPASTMPQTAFDKKAFDMGASGATGQSQYQLMTLETDQGPIQVPVDVQAASKVADEKRKRNATASHRFRQRRKEKEQETSNNIAKLEAQVREMVEDKEHYQRERDIFHSVIQQHRIPLPPRPPTPSRRRHVSLGAAALAQYQDTEARGRNEGRNTRRRTSAYVPAQGPPPQAAEPPPPMPPMDRISSIPLEHIQALQNRMRPRGPYPPSTNAFDPPATPR